MESALITALRAYRSNLHPEKENAEAFLECFQKSQPNSWSIVTGLLRQGSRVTSEVKLFAAQTLHSKIKYDFHQLSEESSQNFRTILLDLLLLYSAGPHIILTQICISIAALALQLETWDTVIDDVVQVCGSSEDSLEALLQFLAIFPEEVYDRRRVTINDAERSDRTTTLLADNADRVIDLLLTLTQRPSFQAKSASLFFTCLSSWLSIITIAKVADPRVINLILPSLFENRLLETALKRGPSVFQATREVANEKQSKSSGNVSSGPHNRVAGEGNNSGKYVISVSEVQRTTKFQTQTGEWYRFDHGNLLGSGGYGRVYKGVQVSTGQFCAIKEMTADEIFHREIKSMNILPHHKNILRLLGHSCSIDGLGYLVFELCEGTLELLITKNLDEENVAKFTRDILAALEIIHRHNCIHRDLKLSNCLLKDGRVVLGDFGLARECVNTIMTAVGTIDYTPPEVFEGRYGPSCDIWNLGLCVYRLLGGPKCEHPEYKPLFSSLRFHCPQGSFEELVKTALGTDGVSENCLDFLKQCLQLAPDARPTASTLLEHPFVRSSPQMVDDNRLAEWVASNFPSIVVQGGGKTIPNLTFHQVIEKDRRLHSLPYPRGNARRMSLAFRRKGALTRMFEGVAGSTLKARVKCNHTCKGCSSSLG